MELTQLEAFVQVAAHRSFSRAAEALDLTQPSVTARIQTLERELGEHLFERNGRRVKLTDVGEIFLGYAERALENVHGAKNAIEALRNAECGNLRIGSALTISTYVLPRILKAFRTHYPGVDVSVSTGRSEHVLEMLVNDEVQVGLVRDLVHPEIETIQLYGDQVILVSDPNHTFAQSRTAAIEEVSRQPLIFFDKGSSYYGLIHGIFRDAGLVPIHAMQLDSMEATKKMVEEGLGIAMLPRVSVERELKLGLLAEIEITDAPRYKRQIALIFRRDRPLARAVIAFVETLHGMYRFDLPESSRTVFAQIPLAARPHPHRAA